MGSCLLSQAGLIRSPAGDPALLTPSVYVLLIDWIPERRVVLTLLALSSQELDVLDDASVCG
jgi:hypothetical protein